MQIKHEHTDNAGTFFMEDGGGRVAEMTYEQKNKTMIIDHTYVDEALRGKNIGYQLVKEGVDYAKRSGLNIMPVCTFAKKVMQEHEDLQGLLS